MTTIRPAGPADIDPVCELLHTKMNRRIPLDRWPGIMTYPWLTEKPDLGWLVEDNGDVVGYLGLIYADRTVSAGGTARIACMTSMYLAKTLRGSGVGAELVALALADPAVTYIAISSTAKTHVMLANRGFRVLDDHRYIWRKSAEPTTAIEVVTDPAAIAAAVPEDQRKLLADHAPYRVTPVLLKSPDGDCLLMLAVREKSGGISYHEALHVSAPDVLARHAQSLADALLPPGSAVLAVDCRFLADQPVAAATEPLPVPRSYITPNLAPPDVDFLYTEIPVLDLKLD